MSFVSALNFKIAEHVREEADAGIENQSGVHDAMPVRNMLYDALQYEKQARELGRKHRREHDTGTREEYLSGVKKQVVSITKPAREEVESIRKTIKH